MSQDAGGPSGPKEEQTIAVGVVSANEEKWWIDPASPPEATRFAQSCESLFESGEGVLACSVCWKRYQCTETIGSCRLQGHLS